MKMSRPLAAVAALTLAASAIAQNPPAAPSSMDRGQAKATVAGKAVAVEYGRPVLAGRDMLGMARPGTPWRMGSNSPTALKTDADLTFGPVAVPKGSYTLTAVKGENGTWTMIATNPTDKSAVQIPLTSSTLKDSVEQFTIELKGEGAQGEFAMMWGTLKMSAPFTGK
jgi:hypothetical protein